MENLFIIQLLTSFIIGGGFIALLSFISEKIDKKYSGIVLAFPSTIAISLFFIGWSTSSQAVVEIIPSTFIPLSISILVISLYPYIAFFIKKLINIKSYQIIISLFLVIILWFILILPFILFKFSNLYIGIIGYFIITFIAHFILKRKDIEKSISIKYTKKQKLIRIIFIGLFMTLIVFLSKTLNPFWGGVFGMFPIAFISIVAIVHINYGVKNIFPFIENIAIGSLSLFCYMIISLLSFDYYGFIYGTIISYILTSIFTIGLIFIQKKK